MSTSHPLPLRETILVPALVTLGVTLLRLTGELLQWSPRLFSRQAGGAGALVGIVWLVPLFGILFALKLARAGERPSSTPRAFGLAFLAFALVPASRFVARALGVGEQSFTAFGIFVAVSCAAGFVAYRAWPALGRLLFAYALAARVPVVLVMLVAMLGDWGTHYDVAPPGFPEMGVLPKWLLIGVLPQLTIWVWFTLAVGAVFGTVAAGLAARRPEVPAVV